MAIVLGIDPGSLVTGFGLIDAQGSRSVYVASGCIRTAAQADLAGKLVEIFAGVTEIIQQYNPSEMAIEKVFMAKSAASALKLGHARGVALVAGAKLGLDVFEYEARKIKQAVVGTGAADKSQVQHMVQTLLKLPAQPQQDAADALAIALCHINTQQNLKRIAGANSYRRGRMVNLGSNPGGERKTEN